MEECGNRVSYRKLFKKLQIFPLTCQCTEGAKKCIHTLRDIYVKCLYIFWHPLYIYFINDCSSRIKTSTNIY